MGFRSGLPCRRTRPLLPQCVAHRIHCTTTSNWAPGRGHDCENPDCRSLAGIFPLRREPHCRKLLPGLHTAVAPKPGVLEQSSPEKETNCIIRSRRSLPCAQGRPGGDLICENSFGVRKWRNTTRPPQQRQINYRVACPAEWRGWRAPSARSTAAHPHTENACI